MSAIGHCKVCASPLVKEINKRLKRGDTLTSLVSWCDAHDFKVTRQKLADHKQHITDPRETFVDNAKKNPVIKSGVTDDEFTQLIIDYAHQRVVENPEDITVGMGLAAVKARATKKQSTTNVMLLVAQASRGRLTQSKPEVIEGEYAVVEELQTSE